MSISYAANAIGDSFLNKCYSTDRFFGALSIAYTPFFGWTEPYPLLLLLLILLIILPTIFKYSSINSFLKISRLYNITRLSLISLLHQIGYSYTLIFPIASFSQQPSPCIYGKKIFDSFGDYSFPNSIIMSSEMFIFSVLKFSGTKKVFSIILSLCFLLLSLVFAVASGLSSIFQAISTVLIAYIVHCIHMITPFKFIHFENIFLFLLVISSLGVLISKSKNSTDLKNVFFSMWFSFVVLIIDEYILLRHHFTRGTFRTIEKSGDLIWDIETHHSETIRLINSEEEESFQIYLKSDIITSFFSFIVFFIGILMRRLIVPTNFFEAPN